MANIPIWPGSSSFQPGDTPFGFYDFNPDFQIDADKVAKFCSLRLGYPIENVELQDINFYAAFEEAVTVYSNELFAYKQREDYLSLEGSNYSYEETNVDFSNALITPNLQPIINLSQQYGTWAGVGGNVDWERGSVAMTQSVQDYDLDVWAASQGLTGSDVEIMRVFYQPLPPSFQFLGDMGYNGTAMAMFGDSAGYTAYGANSFLMMPLSYDMQAIQTVEMYRDVLFSNYTFQLINNKLRIFPIPDVNDSGVPYRNVDYDSINSVGRAWIFEYTLALAKEMLGYVRGKYTQVPIPGAEVTLNQADLLSSAEADKNKLIDRLRDYFDQTSRQSLLERRSAESDARMNELDKVPMTIYVG